MQHFEEKILSIEILTQILAGHETTPLLGNLEKQNAPL